MKPEVATLFGELSGVPPYERERYYAAHSISEDVRREVESLIAFDSGAPLENIVHKAVGLAFQEPVSGGDYCGPFQLLRLIGRGGMGVVYLAERVDGEVRQRVAVKLLRASLDSTAARQRFLQERQILAHLAHPNIARLVDAGHRADGYPYLVMEYIEGQPIDVHCRDLSVREKVAMMAAVCDAIASAHQKLVVHRDLKPGNILVDGAGHPRVLDFGIAKLMDESDATQTMERRLTPEYASPEQIRGETVTTATDIYSLGAVLYKLLTGKPPDRDKLSPPSATCPAAKGDLDAVVVKALRAEPEERYTTADKLAEDLRAWLHHRAVAARYAERWYRARRQLRRYWALAAAGAIAAASLVGGLVIVRAERDIAQQRFADVRKLANEFFVVEKEMEGLAGSTALRERMVKTSIQYLEGLTKRAGKDWKLKAEIAAGYRKAAEAQGITRGVNLGRPADAEESLRKAAALLAEIEAAAPGDRAVLHDRIELVELESRLEYGRKNLKALDAKLAELQTLLTRYESSAKEDPGEWQFVGKVYESMAISARELNRIALPMRFARRSVELQRKLAAVDRSHAARGRLANALSAYGGLLRASGDIAGAVDTYREALAVYQLMAAANPDHYITQLNIANTHAAIGRNLGDPLGPSLRQTEEAKSHLEESLRIGRRLMALDANERQVRFNHSVAAWRLGDMLRARDPRAALAAYDEGAALLRPMPAKQFNRDVPLVATLAESTFALRALRREPEVRPRLEEARAICETYRAGPPAVYETCREFLSRAEAAVALAGGRPLDAVAAHRDWLTLTQSAQRAAEVEEDIFAAYQVANRYALLRDALRVAGLKPAADEAGKQHRAIIETWKKKLSAPNDPELFLNSGQDTLSPFF